MVRVFDSLYPKPNGQIRRQLLDIYKRPDDEWPYVLWEPMQLQTGAVDCGCFVIAVGTELCLDQDPAGISSMRFDQARLRSHLQSIFESGQLSRFPKQAAGVPRVATGWFALAADRHLGPFESRAAAEAAVANPLQQPGIASLFTRSSRGRTKKVSAKVRSKLENS